jgi:hypothetical protein
MSSRLEVIDADDEISILELLEGARIVNFEIMGDKVSVEECCDNWFRVALTKNALSQLIAELQAIHDRM